MERQHYAMVLISKMQRKTDHVCGLRIPIFLIYDDEKDSNHANVHHRTGRLPPSCPHTKKQNLVPMVGTQNIAKVTNLLCIDGSLY